MERVTYADLEVGDIIQDEGKEFVYLGSNYGISIGINDDELHYYPADFVNAACMHEVEVTRVRKINAYRGR